MSTAEEKLAKILAIIEPEAKKTLKSDDEDFMVDDYAGGNIDDAYSLGVDEGYTMLAKRVMEAIK